jgi:hypothetical protein
LYFSYIFRYAQQERDKKPPTQYAPNWKPVTRDSLKAFVGLCTTMGVMRLPAKYDYWRRTKWLLRTSFNEVMPRDEFMTTWRYLHLTDNQAPRDGLDRLWKLRPYLDHLYGKFESVYIPPTGHYTVDESMVKFKGRLGFKQYMPAKPTKWGVKIWSLCESTTGYLSHFQVYTGKENGVVVQGLSNRVVDELLGDFSVTRKGLTVYMDNFYTSVKLLNDLLVFGTNACGTIRSNRVGLPRDLLPRNVALRKHEKKTAQKNELTFAIWQDTKPVCVLSNFHDPQAVGNVNRRVGDRPHQVVEAPQALADYQLHMKGVDLMDQMVGYYLLNHRSKKWWRRVFFYLFSVSVHNSYVLAKACHPDFVRQEWPNLQDFVEDLAHELVGDYRSRRHAPVPLAPLRPQSVHHVVVLFEKKKVCKECSLSKPRGVRPGATRYGCQECQEPVHLTCQGAHAERHNLS